MDEPAIIDCPDEQEMQMSPQLPDVTAADRCRIPSGPRLAGPRLGRILNFRERTVIYSPERVLVGSARRLGGGASAGTQAPVSMPEIAGVRQ